MRHGYDEGLDHRSIRVHPRLPKRKFSRSQVQSAPLLAGRNHFIQLNFFAALTGDAQAPSAFLPSLHEDLMSLSSIARPA